MVDSARRLHEGMDRCRMACRRLSAGAVISPALQEGSSIMRVLTRYCPIVLGVAMIVSGCGSPPAAEVDAAKASVDKAAADPGAQYAAESVKAAQDARAALDAELKVQDGKLMKSYDRTKELAAAAKVAGDKAAADAAAGKEQADAVVKRKADAAATRAKMRASAVRPGGRIMPPKKIKNVPPVYPALARTAGVAGEVEIEATIGIDGKVADAEVTRSIPLLDQAALDAVRQWEYLPTMLNGTPVPVVVKVTINFAR